MDRTIALLWAIRFFYSILIYLFFFSFKLFFFSFKLFFSSGFFFFFFFFFFFLFLFIDGFPLVVLLLCEIMHRCRCLAAD
ncbi:hypothetical protein M440DRAFT_233144 [Trichoderma longibrachiatum ATCC 18648]|uniref:Uncharacterized protein n=1 Tax=Trichoderma longibrachiatum ATCC 18648 TaxID=983965 RepID=A0A2T4CCI2_TRILO|nr:hypothetical protein M440DRAFT_233144 [Trichoderma longibrachiatum ATCC 18648]